MHSSHFHTKYQHKINLIICKASCLCLGIEFGASMLKVCFGLTLCVNLSVAKKKNLKECHNFLSNKRWRFTLHAEFDCSSVRSFWNIYATFLPMERSPSVITWAGEGHVLIYQFFLAHLSQRLKWAIVIAHRPSSVRPSVVVRRPSVRRKLSHFRLLLWNRWTEFNETWQKARSQRPLPSLCFSSRLEKQDGRPGLWLAETFSTSSLKPLNRIQRNLTGSKISMPSTKFVFFGPIGKTRWPPWPLIG